MCMGVLPGINLFIYAWCLQRQELGIRLPGTKVTDSWELLWVLRLKPGSSGGTAPVFLTTSHLSSPHSFPNVHSCKILSFLIQSKFFSFRVKFSLWRLAHFIHFWENISQILMVCQYFLLQKKMLFCRETPRSPWNNWCFLRQYHSAVCSKSILSNFSGWFPDIKYLKYVHLIVGV